MSTITVSSRPPQRLPAVRFRLRVVVFLALALLSAATDSALNGRTLAYFTSRATTAGQTMGTVHLDVSTAPSVSGVFNIAANMLPGDFQVRTFDVSNNGTVGVAQQAFTYAVASADTGAGNVCSLLDAHDPPTCAVPAVPSAAADTGAALLLLRCTSDASASVPLDCGSPNVYVTQVYPSAGAGTQQHLAGGLTRAAVGGVATGSDYSIDIAATSFTGGPLVIGTPFGMGGADAVSGADGQNTGLEAGRVDHLASVVYLPTQAGPSLADQTSVLTFTWTATQRLGGTR